MCLIVGNTGNTLCSVLKSLAFYHPALSSSIVSLPCMSPAEIGISVSRFAKACWITDCPPTERKWDPTARRPWSLRHLPNTPTLLLSGEFASSNSHKYFQALNKLAWSTRQSVSCTLCCTAISCDYIWTLCVSKNPQKEAHLSFLQ